MMKREYMKLGFIGAGNMAEAILRGLIHRQMFRPEQVMAADPSAAQRERFAESFGVAVTGDNRSVVNSADVLILAVKPQMMAEVLSTVQPGFRGDQIVISIAAGIRTEKLDALCGGLPSIVRVMPNTPALIGKGVSALCAGPRASEDAMKLAESLFASVGATLIVNENAMDAVTAISGSGPAYVFYWMEAMLKAATELGFDPATARTLVYETVTGAAALASESSEPPDLLRARVTSKGGTTEAALAVLNEQGVAEALNEAIKAAAHRSRALSG